MCTRFFPQMRVIVENIQCHIQDYEKEPYGTLFPHIDTKRRAEYKHPLPRQQVSPLYLLAIRNTACEQGRSLWAQRDSQDSSASSIKYYCPLHYRIIHLLTFHHRSQIPQYPADYCPD